MKKIISIILTLTLLFSLSSQVMAMDELKYLSVKSLSDIDKCVIAKTDEFNEIKTIESAGLKRITSMTNVTNEEKVAAIFEQMGITYTEQSQKQKEIVDNLDSISAVTSKTSYVKISEDGTQKVVSKEEYLSKKEKIVSPKMSAQKAINIVTDGYEETDGYMKIAIMYIYNGNGNYLIGSEWSWKYDPAFRRTDAFSLYSTMLTFNEKGTKSYEKVIGYRVRVIQNLVTKSSKNVTKSDQSDPKITSSGAYYTWNLPNTVVAGTESVNYDNLMCQMWANVRVQSYGNHKQQLSVYSTYLHNTIDVVGSFSMSATAHGVTVTPSVSLKLGYREYNGYFSWNYESDVKAYGK